MGAEIQDTRLIIKIENKNPVELLDLTKSLVALSKNFERYSQRHGVTQETKEAKLYVREIKTGSIIVELFELASAGIIPYAETTNTIIDFAIYFKSAINYLLKKEGSNPDLSPTEYRELSAIIDPVAKDNGSQFNLSTSVNGDLNVTLNINSTESNAIQNIIDKQVKKLQEPKPEDEIHERVVLTWYQARSDLNSKVGNKGVVESLDVKPKNIVFDSDDLKAEILHAEINPLNTAYVVDVRIELIHGLPKIYRVLRLHEYFEIDEND